MRYLKSVLLIVLVFYCISDLFGQSRTSATNTPVIQSQSEKLRTATGWQLDAIGNWISNQNAISDTKLTETTKYTVPQNFIWLQFVSLKNGSQDIYALLYETNVYVSSTQNERRVYYFLMTDRSYSSIASTIKAKTGETLTIISPSFGYMSDSDGIYSANKLLQLMAKSISDKNDAQECTFSINAQHVDNEDVVRFLLPQKSSEINNTLTNNYFETKWNDFNQILLPVAINTVHDEFDLGNLAPSTSANTQLSDVNKKKEDNIELRNDSLPQRIVANDSLSLGEDSTNLGLNERINKERSTISEPFAVLSGIEGWYLNREGDWVTDKNYSYQFESVGRYEMRSFRYRNKDYILITRVEKYAGETFYLIDKDDYINALAEMDNSSIVRFPLVAHADLSYSLDEMTSMSEEAIDSPKKQDAIIFKTDYLVVQYKLSESKNIARFFFFQQECSKYGSETSKESCNPKVSKKIRYDDEALLGSDVLFSKMYYESTYSNFVSFIRKPASTIANKRENESDFDFSR